MGGRPNTGTKMRRSAILLLLLVCFCSNIRAQQKERWADTILGTFEKDISMEFKGISKYADTLLFIYSRNQDDCKWVTVQLFKSKWQLSRGKFKEAFATLILAQNKLELAGCEDEPLKAALYLQYATVYIEINEKTKASHYVNKGIESWNEKWKDKEVLVRLYIMKGGLENQLEKQLPNYTLAYRIAKEVGDEKLLEMALNATGTAYAMNGENEKGAFYLQQALIFALKRNSYSALSGLYNNLAGLSTDETLILKYVDSAYYYAALSGDLGDQEISLQNKAYAHYNMGKYRQGYDLLWEALVLQDSMYNVKRISAFAEMEQQYESEKKSNQIVKLKNENEIALLMASRRWFLNIGLAGALLFIIFIAFNFYRQTKRKQKLNNELTIEKKKSDDLLLNILPEEIADELKATGEAVAKQYNHVTVLFTDFVNFTGVSMDMSPKELVEEINRNFTAFDAIMDEYGLEKIKTIGDAYLAVCGLPNETEDHAHRVVKAGLAIQQFMQTNNGRFQIRMGIHSGSVVAGIVGVKKYAYDIWGDTVNTAARMEQHSEQGKINISGDTYELIKGSFDCEYRGKVLAKNKGEIDMYFVNRNLGEG